MNAPLGASLAEFSAVAGLNAEADNAPAALPENWYILAASRELSPGGILACEIADRDIVLARTQAGRLMAFDAHCAHMGCHLKHGDVDGDHLRCGLHRRRIGADGCFLTPDGRRSTDLVQPTYGVTEHLGAVFVYLGRGAPPALPHPEIIPPETLLAAPAGEFRTPTPWHALIANGFDMEHLLAVHARELKEQPVISRPDQRSFRIAYRTRVTGTGLSDRLMKSISGDDIRASMTTIGGTLMMVQSMAGPRPSMFLLSFRPDRAGGSIVRTVGGIAGNAANPLDRLRLAASNWLFRSFLSRDFRIFDGLDWHPPAFRHSPGDRYTRQLFDFFLELKGAPAPQRRGLARQP